MLFYKYVGFAGFLDIEELLFDECYGNDEIKWNLLLWSLGLNPQIQFALKNLPKHYVMTVLALIFLYQVIKKIHPQKSAR